MRRAGRIIGLLALLLAEPVAAWAAEACEKECGAELACLLEAADCLTAAGRAGEVVARLKPLVAEQPEHTDLARLLARAYLAAGNPVWALRTLQGLVDADESDCTSRAWLAWVLWQQGDLELAERALAAERCPAAPADQARWALLLSGLAGSRKDPEAQQRLFAEVAGPGALYPEDARVYAAMQRQLDPLWTEPIHLQAELSAGYASNVSAGLPVTQQGAETGSPLLRLELFGRFGWPLWRTVRPTLELGAKLHLLDDFDYADSVDVHQANYFEGSLRPGLQLSLWGLPAFVGYHGDVFVLNQPDEYEAAPQIYYEGHRAELELEPGAGLTLFAGFGKRVFRSTARTRWEVDGGLGWSAAPLSRLQLLLALNLRYHSAARQLYDQLGGTALAVGRLRLPAGWTLRASLSAGLDYYPNAGPDEANPDRGGRDWLVKPGLALWSPARWGLRLGAAYEYAWRDSTARVSFSYDDHRGLLKVRWDFEANPLEPAIVEDQDRVRLPWGATTPDGGLGEERIQDLLRQDEAARRGSSCVN